MLKYFVEHVEKSMNLIRRINNIMLFFLITVTSNRTSNENTSLGNESLIKYDAENESVEVDVTDNTNLLNIKKTGLSNWLKRSLRRLREGFGTYLKDLRMFMW